MTTSATSAPPAAPGPRGLPLVGVLPQMRADPLHFLADAGARHGGVVRLDLGVQQAFLVSDAAAIKRVLQTNAANYPKIDALNALLGEGLATSEGDLWRRQRRLMQPAFHRERLARFADLMVEHARAMLGRWLARAERDEPFDAADEASRLTQAVIVRSMFSGDVGPDADALTRAFLTALSYLNGLVFAPLRLPLWLPTAANRRFVRAATFLDAFVYGLIAERKRRGPARDGDGDLLDMLIEARDESGEGMSERQMRDEVLIIFLAGQDTTAVTLAWAWYELARRPALQERLADEARAAFGDRAPRAEDLPKLALARRVLDETLRLYPPAWLVARKARGDDELGGYRVPGGSTVLVSAYVAHRRPEVWADAESFDPDRFLPGLAEGRPRFSYLPFGGGPRLCIGNNFALMQATLTLSLAARDVRLEPAPGGEQVTARPDLTLRPAPGVLVRASRR